MDLLGSLFAEPVEEEEVSFSFDEVSVSWSQECNESTVTFRFSYGSRTKIESSLTIGERLTGEHTHALFCVGMCVLPWYWMGYGCRTIVVSADVCPFSPKILEFWQTLYSNVLLEYLHCNKCAQLPTLLLSEKSCPQLPAPVNRHERSADLDPPVLVPIGGDPMLSPRLSDTP
jgi:hypothetical protein